MKSSFVSIIIYDYPEDGSATIHRAVVQYAGEDNDLMYGTIVETSDEKWWKENYRKIVDFADKELRSLGVHVR